MAKTQHTPGPWKVEFSQISAPDEKKCIVQFGFNIRENPQALANARLIAAAPELLAALKALSSLEVRGHALIDRLQFSDEGRALASQITNAIAKATGE